MSNVKTVQVCTNFLAAQCSQWFSHIIYWVESNYSFAVFEEPEDPNSRSFFSEIISSISDVKFSYNGRYMITRDYLSVKVWDLNMENKPVESFQVSCESKAMSYMLSSSACM